MNHSQHKPGGRVGIIYTGGTFGMLPSDRGYTPDPDLPQRVAEQIDELDAEDMPAITWLDSGLGPPVNSSDIRPKFWYRLAETIRARAQDFDGFVIIHGTDTLAFTGSALSFLLADVDCPIVVTGASRPLGEDASDAPGNLLGALRVVALGQPTEMSLVFGDRVLRANRSSKRYPTDQYLFDSPHLSPLAHIGDEVVLAEPPSPLPEFREKPPVYRDVSMALIPVHPGIDATLLHSIADRGADAVLLEGYPAGIGPGGDPAFVDAIRRLTDAGMLVAAISQSRLGRIRMGRYATSTPLAEAGLISGADMTREAALTKLHYLFAQHRDVNAAREAFVRNLRGELTPDPA